MTEAVRESTVHVGALALPTREAGPANGEPVVLLHGFPDCLRTFDAQLAALAAAGYRAIAPAMRGYAPSAIAADGDYHVATLAEDLVGLLDALELSRVHLVGHDWGAVTGWMAVAMAPARFASFTSLAIPPLGGMGRALLRYPGQVKKSWYIGFFQLRGIADRAVAKDDYAFIERLWRDWSPGWNAPADVMEAVKATFRQPGVARAALGYYRCLFDLASPANRRAQRLVAAPIDVRVLAMHGRDDGCMDARLPRAALREPQLRRGVELVTIADAGHFLHLEQPEQVSTRIVDFLRACR
jgi:pimeloyl-ACP methyl ester carboxylesterase